MSDVSSSFTGTDDPSVLDDSDADDKTGVMIALLPVTTDWCKIDLPHMTLVYAGTTDKLKPTDFNELAKDAAALAMLSSTITLRVLCVDQLGDTEKVDALMLEPTSEVLAMRRAVEDWNQSKFPFTPHATIGPIGSSVMMSTPRWVAFNRIYVGWGEESLTFWLKNSSSGYSSPSDY